MLWNVISDGVHIRDLNFLCPHGRPAKRRISSFLEDTKKFKTSHKCSRSGLLDQHRSTCKNPLNVMLDQSTNLENQLAMIKVQTKLSNKCEAVGSLEIWNILWGYTKFFDGRHNASSHFLLKQDIYNSSSISLIFFVEARHICYCFFWRLAVLSLIEPIIYEVQLWYLKILAFSCFKRIKICVFIFIYGLSISFLDSFNVVPHSW